MSFTDIYDPLDFSDIPGDPYAAIFGYPETDYSMSYDEPDFYDSPGGGLSFDDGGGSFWDDIFSTRNVDFARAITGIIRNFGGVGKSSTMSAMEQRLAEAAVYSRAAGDPTSERFKGLHGQLTDLSRRNLVAGINEIMKANNRARARGALGVGINPERRDEALSSAILRGFQGAGDRAFGQTIQSLMASAQGMRGAAPTWPTIEGQMDFDADNFAMTNQGLEGIFDILGATKKPKTSQYSTVQGSPNLASAYPTMQQTGGPGLVDQLSRMLGRR